MREELIECPYREVCKGCPGDDDNKEWKPLLGFKKTEEGILCLDWKIVISLEDASQLKTSEGKHIVDSVIAADKLDAARRRWSKTPKRKEAQRRYEEKEKGQATIKKYQQTEKFKLSVQKYYFSKKGQDAHLKRRKLVKDFRQAAKWLKEHPGKTYEDYLKELDS